MAEPTPILSRSKPVAAPPKREALALIPCSLDELGALIEARLEAVLAAQAPAPVLLDRAGVARALDVSTASVSRLVADGMPHVLVGDHARFKLADVIAWLESRSRERRSDKP